MQNQFQHIAHLLQQKQWNQAIDFCLQLLQTSNHPQIHLFLAIAYGEKGELTQSNEIFTKLLSHFPQNPDIHYNFGLVLQNNDKIRDAITSYLSCLQLQPDNAACLNNLGECYRQQENYAHALECFNKCVSLQPHNLNFRRNLAICHYQNNNFDAASGLLINLLPSGKLDSDECVALLDTLLTLRNLKKATEVSEIILQLHPDSADILNMTGLMEVEKRKFIPAIKYLEQALDIDPNHLQALCHLCSAYMFSGQSQRGLELIPRITSFKQESAHVFAATQMETNNLNQEAEEIIQKGLELFPESSELALVLARILRKEKKYTDSMQSIQKALINVPRLQLKASIYYEQGQVLDKLKRYNEAWESFTLANQTSLNGWRQFHSGGDNFVENSELIANSFSNTINTGQALPAKLSSEYSGRNLIFIFGFPRSGTTLLDSILSAHSQVTVLEEAPVIGEVYEKIKNIHPANYARVLSQLSPKEITRHQQYYFQTLKNYTDWNGQGVLVDKSPLNTLHVGMIHTIFPDAKLLFVVRHPLDACLSSFFQDFKMNSFMTHLTSMKSATETYHSMLDVWKSSVDNFEIPVIYQKYEELVSDFSNQTKFLLGELDLPWEEQILKYQESLKNRGSITTPSYNQVNQPIYQTARFRYKNYLPQVEDSINTLRLWLDYFKYDI